MRPGSPVRVRVSRLLVLETFRVVEFTNGIVSVLKKNVVFVELDRIEPGTVKSFVTTFAKLLVVKTFIKFETKFEVVTELETARLLSVPTLVIFGWAGWLTTSAKLDEATFPTRFDELMFESPEAFEAIKRPLIVKRDETVPTDVMLG